MFFFHLFSFGLHCVYHQFFSLHYVCCQFFVWVCRNDWSVVRGKPRTKNINSRWWKKFVGAFSTTDRNMLLEAFEVYIQKSLLKHSPVIYYPAVVLILRLLQFDLGLSSLLICVMFTRSTVGSMFLCYAPLPFHSSLTFKMETTSG